MKLGRREFITRLAAAGAMIPLGVKAWGNGVPSHKKEKLPLTLFTKPLDGFEPEFMAETVAMAGIDGFDLTVRPGGRVIPERVAEDLPKVVEIGRQYGLSTPMMVTSISEADAEAEKVLKTAVACGVKHYRLGYFNYDYKKGIWETLQEIKRKIESLARLNEEVGIQAGYQNHSGIRVGAPVWDIWELIRDFPIESISNQFDIRHAVTEGSSSWQLSLRLMSKNIGSLAIKDFTWDISNGKARAVSVPLGEGIVDFDLFFSLIMSMGLQFHLRCTEYPLLERGEDNLSLLQKQKIIVAKLKRCGFYPATPLGELK